MLFQCVVVLSAHLFESVFSVKLGDVHTSAAQLMQLVHHENQFISQMQSYLIKEEQRIQNLKRYENFI